MGAPLGTAAAPLVSGSRLLGSARDLQRAQLGTYARAMREHGAMARFRVGPPRLGFEFDAVFEPDGARSILSGVSTGYVKDAPVYHDFTRLFGEGLFTLNGEEWRRRRRILQPSFTRQRVQGYIPLMSGWAEELVRLLRDRRDDTGLPAAAVHYTLNVLGAALFGEDMASAGPVLHRAVPMINAEAARRGLAPVRLPPWLPTPAHRRTARAQQDLRSVVDGIVRGRGDRRGADDLLERLISARDPETGEGLSKQSIRDEALIFLGAGLDPPPNALAFTLYLLGGHEEAQQRVREEVRRVLGDRPPDAADLPALEYTTMVADEALRLYPPGHTLLRRATVPDKVCGHPVPAGRIMAVSVWGIHHNSKVWADPYDFRPERFDPAIAADRDTYAYLPFGGGSRTCIGKHLAHAQLVVAVATVVRALRIRAADREPPTVAGLTLMTGEPFRCAFEPLAD
jgi:cytochrome P450